MSYPFGGHPNLATYIVWLKEAHQGNAQSGFTKGEKGKTHSLTKLSLPNGKSVVMVGVSQSENLAPSVIGYLDRRLDVTSPWFSPPPDDTNA